MGIRSVPPIVSAVVMISPQMRYLIVNADDFGYTEGVTAGSSTPTTRES